MKRAFDLVIVTIASPVWLSALLVMAVLVRMRVGAPIFFLQIRPGVDGRPFRLFKFRTMKDFNDSDGMPLPDSDRLTTFGQWLRATSMDELPEFWNVMKGDMSLVGPRPLLMDYVALYSPEQARRQAVRPGITGWAQVNGRNAISWDERFRLDVWYVDHRTFWLDLKILWLTIAGVVRRTGISPEGEATMPRFTGGSN